MEASRTDIRSIIRLMQAADTLSMRNGSGNSHVVGGSRRASTAPLTPEMSEARRISSASTYQTKAKKGPVSSPALFGFTATLAFGQLPQMSAQSAMDLSGVAAPVTKCINGGNEITIPPPPSPHLLSPPTASSLPMNPVKSAPTPPAPPPAPPISPPAKMLTPTNTRMSLILSSAMMTDNSSRHSNLSSCDSDPANAAATTNSTANTVRRFITFGRVNKTVLTLRNQMAVRKSSAPLDKPTSSKARSVSVDSSRSMAVIPSITISEYQQQHCDYDTVTESSQSMSPDSSSNAASEMSRMMNGSHSRSGSIRNNRRLFRQSRVGVATVTNADEFDTNLGGDFDDFHMLPPPLSKVSEVSTTSSYVSLRMDDLSNGRCDVDMTIVSANVMWL